MGLSWLQVALISRSEYTGLCLLTRHRLWYNSCSAGSRLNSLQILVCSVCRYQADVLAGNTSSRAVWNISQYAKLMTELDAWALLRQSWLDDALKIWGFQPASCKGKKSVAFPKFKNLHFCKNSQFEILSASVIFFVTSTVLALFFGLVFRNHTKKN